LNNKKNMISVVIPMYNSRDTIIRAIESIKNQTSLHKISEIIVVNDGSIDNSLEVIQSYIMNNKSIPIIVINKENGGVSSARNAGIMAAHSEWIALLDADDEWYPNKIELQISIIEDNSSIDFLGGDYDDKGIRIFGRKIEGLHKANIKELCIKMYPQTSTVLFKKSIFDKIGGYDEKQKYAEDANYFMKICSKFNYYYVAKQMVVYGGGKPGFGFSGLSANLKGMHLGYMKNINELKVEKVISYKFYLFLKIFYWIKYLRRIIITKTKLWG
jgi:glycosyltransferase involved in cell wall biosynthesis